MRIVRWPCYLVAWSKWACCPWLSWGTSRYALQPESGSVLDSAWIVCMNLQRRLRWPCATCNKHTWEILVVAGTPWLPSCQPFLGNLRSKSLVEEVYACLWHPRDSSAWLWLHQLACYSHAHKWQYMCVCASEMHVRRGWDLKYVGP